MNESKFVERILRPYVVRAGSLRKAGKRLGYSAQYLCDIIRGHRHPSPQVLAKFGYWHSIVKTVTITVRKARSHV